MPLLELTDEEEKLILNRREEIKECNFRNIKQLLCEHDWKYIGHSHNDDAYECRKCNKISFV